WRIYVNGASVASTATTNPNVPTTASSIGGNNTGANPFKGFIDDVRFYNRALSAAEITQLYKQGASKLGVTVAPAPNSPFSNGLVGYWTFDGKDTNWAANTTADKSGQGNTGRMTNMSTTTSPALGKIGQGLKFDGADDNVVASDVASYSPANNSITVSA